MSDAHSQTSAPTQTPVVIRCADGYQLHGREFSPATDGGVTVIIASAMVVRHQFYGGLAAWLAEQGVRAITFDNRGIGESLAGERAGARPRLRHWGELDIPAVIAHARRTAPEHRLMFIGHSMGGQIVSLSDAMHELECIVTVAATAAYWGHWPRPYNVGILAWYVAAPIIGRVLPVIPASRVGLGPDASSDVVRDWVRWGRHRRYLHGPFGLRPQADQYRGRVLALSFTDDAAFGCRRAVEALHADYVAAELEHRHVDPRTYGIDRMGHFGFFQRQGRALWPSTLAWML